MTPERRPFRIDVLDALLNDLRARLARTWWPEAECVDDWSQGVPLAYTRELAAYWADGYDWRSREAALNRFDQFVTEIDGLDIRFIHQRSAHQEALPLLITAGWPGWVVEFHLGVGKTAQAWPAIHPAADAGLPTSARFSRRSAEPRQAAARTPVPALSAGRAPGRGCRH